MKFLNWSKIKSFFRVRNRVETVSAEKHTFEPKSVSFTLPDRRATRINPKRIWERRRTSEWRLPVNVKIKDFVIFPFGITRHTVRSGTVIDIHGNRAKIRMMCKAGTRITYRKIATGTTDEIS